MKSTYKKIGDHIHLVNKRNTDLKVSNLAGLSMTKEFRETTSNIVGTDMSVYKIVNKWQFACDFMSVIRVHKFPVVLKKDDDPVLVSPAYPVFEVNNVNELDPEYLMMWFQRSEFDRYADFKCDSTIRGGYDWTELCNTELPVPHIDKQREIVKEYNVLVDRINLNNQLIKKLEETAQAIYKQWFVDFEFSDENGKPYKSNGGEMEFNEELEKDIPKGWETLRIDEISEIKAGGDKPKRFSDKKTNDYSIPIYSNGITNEGLFGYTNQAKYPKNSVTISARGTIGYSMLRSEPFDAIVRLLVVIPKVPFYAIYLWQVVRKIDFDNSGSVQNQLTIPQISSLKMILPSSDVLEKYDSILKIIYQNKEFKIKENNKLEVFNSLLLSKLATIND
jgi:type I restriction enzyme S subunit